MVAKYEVKNRVARANILVVNEKVVATDGILCWMQGWSLADVERWCDARFFTKLTKIGA